jgi:hypothetical protein
MAPDQALGRITFKHVIGGKDYYLGIWNINQIGPAVCLVGYDLQGGDKWCFVVMDTIHTVNPDQRTGDGLIKYIQELLVQLNSWISQVIKTEDDFPVEFEELRQKLAQIRFDGEKFI